MRAARRREARLLMMAGWAAVMMDLTTVLEKIAEALQGMAMLAQKPMVAAGVLVLRMTEAPWKMMMPAVHPEAVSHLEGIQT